MCPPCTCVFNVANFVCQEGINDVCNIHTFVGSELSNAPIARRIFAGVPQIHQVVPIAEREGDEDSMAFLVLREVCSHSGSGETS